MSANVNDIASAGDAIDFLVGRGLKASEAVEFVGRLARLGKKPKAARAQSADVPQPAPRKVATTWPEGFALAEDMMRFARERGFDPPSILRMWERFRDRNQSRGEKYVDWKAAWRTWVNNQVEFKNRDNRPRGPGGDHIDGRL